MSRTTQCHLLDEVRTLARLVTTPLLTKIHVQKCLKWAEDNMKVNFSSKILLMDKYCAIFFCSDNWCKGWVVSSQDHQHLRSQQGGGGIMIWASIIGGIMVGLRKAPDGIKMIAFAYM